MNDYIYPTNITILPMRLKGLTRFISSCHCTFNALLI